MHKYGLDQPLHVHTCDSSAARHASTSALLQVPSRQVREIIAGALRSRSSWRLALLLAIAAGCRSDLRPSARTARRFRSDGVALAGVSVPTSCSDRCWCSRFHSRSTCFRRAVGRPQSRVLPVLTLATAYVAYIARLTRAGMLEVLRQDFTRTARAKGLSERTVVLKHALKLGILPVVSFIGRPRTRDDGLDRGREHLLGARDGRYLVNAAFTAITRWCWARCCSTPRCSWR